MEESGDQVKCPICPKSFRSTKAMHGHMRTHPRTERSPPSANTVSSHDAGLPPKKRPYRLLSSYISYSDPDQDVRGTLAAVVPKTETHNRHYQCPTCDKTFLTGQALGGHQTSHRKQKPPVQETEKEKPAVQEAKEEKPAVQEAVEDRAVRPRIFYFDLNELP